MSADVLEIGPTSRSAKRTGVLAGLVLVVVVAASVVVPAVRGRVLTPDQVQTALTRSFPERAPAFPLARPTGAPKPFAPAECRPLLLRPWLVDAWPDQATAASQTGPVRAGGSRSRFGVLTFTFAEPREAAQVFDASRRLLEERTCSGAEIESRAFRTVPFTFDLTPRPPVEPTDPECDHLAFETTATDQPGFPHRTRTQLLRYGNTVSWQVQRSPYDQYLLDGRASSTPEDGLPSLAGLCRQLRTVRWG